ncbi:DUF4065 domain-containing protein [Candidatus Poribacteria bacterium]|nr:DUF4065 domain-containing protein [Candidatus Poribacteria bacterium]
MKKDICPGCEKEAEIEMVSALEDIEVRGEPIKVEVEYYKCRDCGEEFLDLNSKKDPLAEAYRIYRQRHCMVQPEEIRKFRKRYGLTQTELSKLLGWGGATLSRYENGALQDDTHETALRLAMEPRNLHELVRSKPEALGPEKRKDLIEVLASEREAAFSFTREFEDRFGNYEPTEFSGYRRLDIRKLFNAILFFCKAGVFTTKLNKLLFYADFKHFKDESVSITGARYLCFQYGPVPEHYDYYLADLIDERALRVEEVIFEKDGVEIAGTRHYSAKDPDLNYFDNTELESLLFVEKHFRNVGAGDISEISHKEVCYANTPTGEPISYKLALQLSV